MVHLPLFSLRMTPRLEYYPPDCHLLLRRREPGAPLTDPNSPSGGCYPGPLRGLVSLGSSFSPFPNPIVSFSRANDDSDPLTESDRPRLGVRMASRFAEDPTNAIVIPRVTNEQKNKVSLGLAPLHKNTNNDPG